MKQTLVMLQFTALVAGAVFFFAGLPSQAAGSLVLCLFFGYAEDVEAWRR